MKEKVLNNILEHKLIERGDNILVGVSGGPDSMALLYVLLDIKRDIEFNIYIAHVNHGVRGEDALSDELFVKSIGKTLDIPYFSREVNMNEYAKEKGISSEEAGRELRYSFFREILSNLGGGKIAVAHNMNDQAETLIMRFLRGTGIDGLNGMRFRNEDIIRPVLNINRSQIEHYVSENNIKTVLDKTNLETIYNRNKIRLNLIPYIEENFNPNIVNTLWRTSQTCISDSQFLEEYSEKRYNIVVKRESKSSIILHGDKFIEENKSIQQRIIRNCINKINGSLQGISEKHTSSVVNLFMNMETGKEIHLHNNIIAKTSYYDFIIEKANMDSKSIDYFYTIDINNITYLSELDYYFLWEVVSAENVKFKNNDPNIKYLDFDKIKGSMHIRNRKPADRFTPFGMKGTKKLKDYFIDEKVSRELRDTIPLLVDEDTIIWVVGYRTNDLYKVTSNTKKILIVKLQQGGLK